MSNLIDAPHPQITHKDLMLATPGKLFSAPGWIYEIKCDGFRCLVCKHGDVVRLLSRRGRDVSGQFPELVSEIRPIPHDFVADGELVILDGEGRPQWDRLHARHMLGDPGRIREAATRDPAAIFAFDLLSLNGADFRQRPLRERKAALHRTLPANRRICYARHLNDDCEPLWQMAVELELEGCRRERRAFGRHEWERSGSFSAGRIRCSTIAFCIYRINARHRICRREHISGGQHGGCDSISSLGFSSRCRDIDGVAGTSHSCLLRRSLNVRHVWPITSAQQ